MLQCLSQCGVGRAKYLCKRACPFVQFCLPFCAVLPVTVHIGSLICNRKALRLSVVTRHRILAAALRSCEFWKIAICTAQSGTMENCYSVLSKLQAGASAMLRCLSPVGRLMIMLHIILHVYMMPICADHQMRLAARCSMRNTLCKLSN